jgi:thioredoxin-like negative regulator of GroEL
VELRVNGGQNALTMERAAQSLDYWRVTAQQLLADPEASASSATLNSYSKLAVGQANLFAERNFTAEAEQTYRVATEIQPANVEAVCGLSEILTRTGRSGEASQILDDFMRKYPNQRGSLEELRKMHAVPVPVTPAPPPPSIP